MIQNEDGLRSLAAKNPRGNNVGQRYPFDLPPDEID